MTWIGIARDLVADGLIPTEADAAVAPPGAVALPPSPAAAPAPPPVETAMRRGARIGGALALGVSLLVAANALSGKSPRHAPPAAAEAVRPMPVASPAPVAAPPPPSLAARDRPAVVRRRKPAASATKIEPVPNVPEPPSPSLPPSDGTAEPTRSRALPLDQVRAFERNL